MNDFHASTSPTNGAHRFSSWRRAAAIWGSVGAALCVAACSPPPELTHAHRLERAASWAESVALSERLASHREVPSTFVRDAIATAAREVDQLASQTLDDPDVPLPMRDETRAPLEALKAALDESARAQIPPDAVALASIELRLRTLARDARTRAGSPS
jgi:hypothetical protein